MATTAETLQSLLEGETANTGAINTLTKQMAGTTASGLMTKIETLDGQAVKISGDQTIYGNKTFEKTIVSKTRTVVRQSDSGSYTQIDGGTNYADGAYLVLVGSGHNDDSNLPAGSFSLITGKDENGNPIALRGRKDGTLTWNAREVVVSGVEQVINGIKKFSSDVHFVRGSSSRYSTLSAIFEGVTLGENPSRNIELTHRLADKDNNPLVDIVQILTTSGSREIHFKARKDNGETVTFATYKSNADGSNVRAIGSTLAHASMPNYNSKVGNIFDFSQETQTQFKYTAPCNGWISVRMYSNSNVSENNPAVLRLVSTAAIGSVDRSTQPNTLMQVFCVAPKDQEVTLFASNCTGNDDSKGMTYAASNFIKCDAEV